MAFYISRVLWAKRCISYLHEYLNAFKLNQTFFQLKRKFDGWFDVIVIFENIFKETFRIIKNDKYFISFVHSTKDFQCFFSRLIFLFLCIHKIYWNGRAIHTKIQWIMVSIFLIMPKKKQHILVGMPKFGERKKKLYKDNIMRCYCKCIW